jgi:hypothetical protein
MVHVRDLSVDEHATTLPTIVKARPSEEGHAASTCQEALLVTAASASVEESAHHIRVRILKL